jgi:hypothetical protein
MAAETLAFTAAFDAAFTVRDQLERVLKRKVPVVPWKYKYNKTLFLSMQTTLAPLSFCNFEVGGIGTIKHTHGRSRNPLVG